jgi:hypothetical protein
MAFSSISQAAVIGTRPWTTIGSAGTAVSGAVTLTGNIAYLDAVRAVVLYNVVAVDGLQANNGPLLVHPVMKARFRDNGANNRIIFRVKRVDLNTGATQTLMTMDSDNYAGSASFQTREVGCGNSFTFDFSNHAYYVEATMSRTNLPVTPGIASIQLGRSSSPCLVAQP